MAKTSAAKAVATVAGSVISTGDLVKAIDKIIHIKIKEIQAFKIILEFDRLKAFSVVIANLSKRSLREL